MMRFINYYFLICYSVLFTFFWQQLFAVTQQDIEYIHPGTNIWHIEPLDANTLAMADYKGRIIKFDKTSQKAIWSYPSQAFVFDLKTGDFDLNGSRETVAVTAQGELLALDAEGKLLWTFTLSLPLFNVVIGNFTGDERKEIACGGIDRHVYIFDASGKLLAKSPEVERANRAPLLPSQCPHSREESELPL